MSKRFILILGLATLFTVTLLLVGAMIYAAIKYERKKENSED